MSSKNNSTGVQIFELYQSGPDKAGGFSADAFKLEKNAAKNLV